jgi:hypothetical protein
MLKNKKEDVIVEKFYDKNGTCIKMICKIPVGNLSKKDSEKRIKELMDLCKNDNTYEYFRKIKRTKRKEKLKKLYE